MPFPFERIENLTPGSVVKAATLMAHEDGIIALHLEDQTIAVSGAAFVPRSPNYAAAVQAFVDDWQFKGPPNDTIVAPLVLPAYRRIKTITWHLNKASNAAPLTLTVRKRVGTASSNVDSIADVSAGAAYTTNVRNINYTVQPGEALFLMVQAGSTVHRFSHAVITLDRPGPL